MTRLLALAALTLIATPAVSEHTPDQLLDRAQQQVRALDRDIDAVRHPHVRRQLEDRVERLDRILRRLERSGALQPLPPPSGPWGPPGRPSGPGLTFQEVLGTVQAESFESGRREVIARIARTTTLTSDQAAILADQMAFESGKRDALIALYPAVADPHRFVLALDILDFSSSRRTVSRQLGL